MKTERYIGLFAAFLICAGLACGESLRLWNMLQAAKRPAGGPSAFVPPQLAALKFWAEHADETGCNAGTYTDSSAAENHGAQAASGSRAVWSSGEDGTLKFDGTADYYVVPAAAGLGAGTGSIAVWMRNGSLPGNAIYRDVWTDKGAPPEGLRICYFGSGGTQYFTFEGYDAGTYQFRLNHALVDDSSYHLIVGTIENNSAKLYIDGILRGTDTATTISYTSTAINVGRDSAYGRYSDAYVGEVLAWPGTVLTSNEQYAVWTHFKP